MGFTSKECYKKWEHSWTTGESHHLTYSQWGRALKWCKFREIHHRGWAGPGFRKLIDARYRRR